MRDTMTAQELLESILDNSQRMVCLPNMFDDAPLTEAISIIAKHDKARLAEIESEARDRNWSQARKESEIRCVADEVYWEAQGD